MVQHCELSNLLIKPRKGKAILWYNHLLHMRTGWLSVLDPLSYHGECAVKKSEKWVANIWINVVGDGQTNFKAWKSETNWLAKNNLDNEIVEPLTNKEVTKELRERSFEMRYSKDKNTNNNIIETNVVKKSERSESISKDKEVKTLNLELGNTPAPLPLSKEQVTIDQNQSTTGSLPPPNAEGNRIVAAILLLLEELDRVEMEIVARLLHERMKLVCIPLMINPVGSLR